MRVEVHPTHPEPRKIGRAVDALERGGLIAYPTDTVYGLGCDAFQKKSIDRLYEMKRMKRDHPVALVCPDLREVARFAMVDDRAYRVLRRLLPGPYTFILPATREVPRVLMMKRRTIGLRVPNHPVALALLAALGRPMVSSSASFEGEVLNDPDEIDDRFPGLEMVLDVGLGGIEPSTILDLTGAEPTVVRKGVGRVDEFE